MRGIISWFADTVSSYYRLTAGYGMKLYGSTSGWIGLHPPSTLDNTVYTLPATAPTVDGEVLSSTTAGTLSWQTGGAGSSVTLTGQNYLTLSGSALTANAVDLSGANVTGTLAAARSPALTGDITSTAGSLTTTLATVNSTVGTFNNVTVNGKGLVTSASNVSYITSNQNISITGDISGSGTTSITATLPTVNSNVGTFTKFTVNGKGLITAAGSIISSDVTSALGYTPANLASLGTLAFQNSVTNISGNAATVTTNANLTGAVTSTGNATSLGSFTSASLLAALTDETGTGSVVFATSPTLVTPILGTPTSGNLANCTFPTLNQNTSGQAGTVATISGLIAQGTNVTISGAGTIASPYTIAATGGGGSSAFSALTSSTNTTAAMIVGTGGSLSVSGSGTITATSAPATGLTGTTIASGVTVSSLTSVGTLTALGCSGVLTDTQNIANVSTDGLLLTNTTAATGTGVAAQSWSPRLHFNGQGNKTSGGNTSIACDAIIELEITSGTANPTSVLAILTQVAGAGYSYAAQFNGANVTLNGASGTSGSTTVNALTANGGVTTTLLTASNKVSSSYAGAASTSVFTTTAAPLATGTSTTNFPQFFANWGGTPVTNWSNGTNNGTVFGINAASTWTGNYFDCHNSSNASMFLVTAAGNMTIGGKTTSYNGIATAGWGAPAVYGTGRKVSQTSAQTLATYTVGSADGSFLISANISVTTSTLHNFTVTVTYTDENSNSQTDTLSFTQLTGASLTAITNATGAGPYEGLVKHYRCKTGTTITVATVGTFTTVTYNADSVITQIA